MSGDQWVMLLISLWWIGTGLRDWPTNRRTGLQQVLFGAAMLLLVLANRTQLRIALPLTILGACCALGGLIVQARTAGSSVRNTAILVVSVIAIACAAGAGVLLAEALAVDSTLGLTCVVGTLVATVGGITAWLLRDDPLLGMPVRFRRTPSES